MQIQLANLRKSYPTPGTPLEVLRGVTLTLARGTTTAILGPSGSGKSTLLSILGTLDTPTSGTVSMESSQEVVAPFSLKPAALAAFRSAHVGFVFQDHHLLPQLTAFENVLLPSLALPAASAKDGERAGWLLNRVGLEDRRTHLPAHLSGGERQRVAIARALMNSPSVLLADEPTGNLDPQTAESIMSLLLSISEETGATLVAVTHNPELARRFGTTLTMHNGLLV